jgi:predicted lactoylglutathione lyase
MIIQIFVKIRVKDLEKSKDFFTKPGLPKNRQFRDETAACVVCSDNIYAIC